VKLLTATLLSLLLALSGGVTAAAQAKKEKPSQRKFTREIPQDIWVPIFFEPIDKRAKSARLTSLRTKLRDDEMEVRVWEIDSLTGVSGFRLRRTSAGWSASYLGSVYSRGRVVDFERRLTEPRSGWEGLWKRLASLDVLGLPDARAIRCQPLVKDGFGYVVETNAERVYRTYRYGNPDWAECAEAKRMLSIAEAIADEFGVEEFKPPYNVKR
jgi:hypothetical protein